MEKFGNWNRPIEAVVLDLDGTLYGRNEYMDAIVNLVERYLRERLRPPGDPVELAATLAAMMAEDWDGTSVTGWLIGLGAHVNDWSSYKDQYFVAELSLDVNEALAGVLIELRKGVRTALYTNNSRIATLSILNSLGISAESFDVVSTIDDSWRHVKPSTNSAKKVIQMLKVDAASTCSIGDRACVDIQPFLEMDAVGILVDGPGEVHLAATLINDQNLKYTS